MDVIHLITKKIDRTGTQYLMFYKNDMRLSEVPSGYRLFLELEEGSEEEQQPFCGAFVITPSRSYCLKYNDKVSVRFLQKRDHDIQTIM